MLQVEILESSFAKIEPKLDKFATSFYNNLFLMYPEAKPLFANTDMEAQKQKLIDSLRTVILNLRYAEALTELLKGLGTRHVQYGALPEHYPAVGNALLQTFDDYLRAEWTPEIKEAWIEAYNAITELMLEGADYSQEEVSLESNSPVKKEDISTPEKNNISSEKKENISTPEKKDIFAHEYNAEIEDNFEQEDSKNQDFEHEDSNSINWGIIAGIIGVLIVAAFLLIFPNLKKDQTPSSQPNQSFLQPTKLSS